MLRIDFYESGIGETIVITFPDGGVGVVDAHPSLRAQRPAIQEIIEGKKIHFVCLSHPHADHGKDLIPILESNSDIGAFWYSVSELDSFIYELQEVNNFPSPFRQTAIELKRGWARFLIDLFGAAAARNALDRHQLHSRIRPITIAGVKIICLSPSEDVNRRFAEAYKSRLSGKVRRLPDPNLLSTILALTYGGTVVLLGADALKENWAHAVNMYHAEELPKARLIKIPHHGAANAIILRPRKGEANYLKILTRTPEACSVLFAGDAKHPSPDVYDKVKERTDLYCLSNGYRRPPKSANPFRINLVGARAVSPAGICNDIVSFELDDKGRLKCVTGHNCDNCFSMS